MHALSCPNILGSFQGVFNLEGEKRGLTALFAPMLRGINASCVGAQAGNCFRLSPVSPGCLYRLSVGKHCCWRRYKRRLICCGGRCKSPTLQTTACRAGSPLAFSWKIRRLPVARIFHRYSRGNKCKNVPSKTPSEKPLVLLRLLLSLLKCKIKRSMDGLVPLVPTEDNTTAVPLPLGRLHR